MLMYKTDGLSKLPRSGFCRWVHCIMTVTSLVLLNQCIITNNPNDGCCILSTLSDIDLCKLCAVNVGITLPEDPFWMTGGSPKFLTQGQCQLFGTSTFNYNAEFIAIYNPDAILECQEKWTYFQKAACSNILVTINADPYQCASNEGESWTALLLHPMPSGSCRECLLAIVECEDIQIMVDNCEFGLTQLWLIWCRTAQSWAKSNCLQILKSLYSLHSGGNDFQSIQFAKCTILILNLRWPL